MARRTTHRTSKGTKLYAKRAKDGTFKDIQTFKRAHAADLRKKSRAEAAEAVVQMMKAGVETAMTTVKKTVKKVAKKKTAKGAAPKKTKATKPVAKKKGAPKKASKKSAGKKGAMKR